MSFPDDIRTPCKDNASCRTYLLTYAQADLQRVPDTASFVNIILDAFQEGTSTSEIVQWACCMEDHEDGGKHFHMMVKLNKPRRWKPIFNSVWRNHSIAVNFSSNTCGYLAGYRYVCKDKDMANVLLSAGHPDLSDARSPKGRRGSKTFSDNAKRRRSEEPESTRDKKKRLTNSDVADFLVRNGIRKECELMAAAKKRSDEGLDDLHRFVLNKNPKALSDLISTTWKLHFAPTVVEREKMDRVALVLSHLDKPCVENCNGIWYECAREVLSNNDINIYVFADAVRRCLCKGRRKLNNVMLTGPTNCGKSFLLNPLELIFRAFVNPAAGKYAWVGLDDAEIAYLNDLRWSEELIKGNDFLLLLEGQTVHLPRPKNQYATDLVIDRENTIPFFATSKSAIEFVGRYNTRDQMETEMMNSRWKIFDFSRQISNVRDIEPCPHCFSRMVAQGLDN